MAAAPKKPDEEKRRNQILMRFTDAELRDLDAFWHEHRFRNRSEAILALMTRGYEAWETREKQ